MNTVPYSRVVDLRHVTHPGIAAWPADPPVVLEQVASLEKQGYNVRRFSMSEHGDTHLNAPIGFCTGGTTVDAYPSDLLVLPAVIFDIRNQVRADADYQLSTEQLLAWEEQYGQSSRAAWRCCTLAGWPDGRSRLPSLVKMPKEDYISRVSAWMQLDSFRRSVGWLG